MAANAHASSASSAIASLRGKRVATEEGTAMCRIHLQRTGLQRSPIGIYSTTLGSHSEMAGM
ncbi:hypothetical protein D3C81_2337080 [compost metagenome]